MHESGTHHPLPNVRQQRNNAMSRFRRVAANSHGRDLAVHDGRGIGRQAVGLRIFPVLQRMFGATQQVVGAGQC